MFKISLLTEYWFFPQLMKYTNFDEYVKLGFSKRCGY